MPTLTQTHPPLPVSELTALIAAFPILPLEEKKDALTRLVGQHVTMSLNWGRDWVYRRTRRLDADIRPETVDELIWRKGELAQLGRANPAGFDVMYLSDRRETSLREARVLNHSIVMAEFCIQSGRSTRVAPIGEFTHVNRSGRGYLLGEASQAVTDMLNACSRDEGLALLITDAFLQDVFLEDDNYELSSHIARAIFAKDDAVTAVAYPSRRHPGGVNFAVRVETFWRDWAFVGARYGRARHLACGYYDLALTQSVDGVYRDGQLRWQGVSAGEGIRLEPYVPLVSDQAK